MPRLKKQRIQIDIQLIGQLATYNGARLNYTFTVPLSVTIGHVVAMLRKTVRINPAEALFVFAVNEGLEVLAPMTSLCSSLAVSNKLKLKIAVESAFGGLNQYPPCIQGIVLDFLMPSEDDVRLRMFEVLTDIQYYGQIFLPGDKYAVREVVEYINGHRPRYPYLE